MFPGIVLVIYYNRGVYFIYHRDGFEIRRRLLFVLVGYWFRVSTLAKVFGRQCMDRP